MTVGDYVGHPFRGNQFGMYRPAVMPQGVGFKSVWRMQRRMRLRGQRGFIRLASPKGRASLGGSSSHWCKRLNKWGLKQVYGG